MAKLMLLKKIYFELGQVENIMGRGKNAGYSHPVSKRSVLQGC